MMPSRTPRLWDGWDSNGPHCGVLASQRPPQNNGNPTAAKAGTSKQRKCENCKVCARTTADWNSPTHHYTIRHVGHLSSTLIPSPALNGGMADAEPDIPSHYAAALKVLEDLNPKPVIALDLDYTLWPSNCYEMTAPPYENSMTYKAAHLDVVGRVDVIFCTDKRTNTIKPFCMYPETRQVLEFCAENDIVLTICSRSPDIQVVEQIMQAFGIWEWFLFPQVYYKRKTFHFRNLTEATGFKMRDFLFFDDEPSNISMCGRMGVNACLVDKETGLNWDTLILGLQSYREKLLCRKSFSGWVATGESPTNSPLVDEGGEDTDGSVTIT